MRFHRTWRQIAIPLSLVLGWIYPAFLSQVTGSVIASPGPWVVALTLTAGTALSLGFARMLDPEDTAEGLKLLAAFHVLAALPRYFFAGCSTPAEIVMRALPAAVIAFIYMALSLAERRIPLQSYQKHSLGALGALKRKNSEPYLPLRLNLSRMDPLLWVLAGFGLLRYLSSFLSQSQANGIRRLAGVGLRLTELSAPEGWLAFILVGLLAKWTMNLTSLSGVELQGRLRSLEAAIPGIGPSRPTAGLIDRTIGRLAWIEPLVTVGTIAVIKAIAAMALWVESVPPGSWWPVLLVPVLFTVLPIWELALAFKAQLTLHGYAGFIQGGRR
jgi:preprotein translocase subunit SecY